LAVHQYHSDGLVRRDMQLIKIESQHEIPTGVWHRYYRGEIVEAIAAYKRRYGYEPETVLITDDGLIAVPSHPANGWVEEQE
jgi:hypothetical protein